MKRSFVNGVEFSFLWTNEERNYAERTQMTIEDGQLSTVPAEAPTHCAGCRRVLPQEGRSRGVVKWYNQRKRYGFIACSDGPEVFMHGSELKGAKRVAPGDLVEFGIVAAQEKKGRAQRPNAVHVRILEKN